MQKTLILMCNLIEHSDSYLTTSGSLWQYYRDELALINAENNITLFKDTGSASFKFKTKVTSQTGNDVTKDFEIMVLLKYLSNFWRTLEMPLINCDINFFLTWSPNCFGAAGA